MEEALCQRQLIQDSQPPDLFRRCKTLFLVEGRWWEQWTRYVGYEDGDPQGEKPGKIDNLPLVEGSWDESSELDWTTARIKDGIREKTDFEYLSPTSWRKLVARYSGGPELEVFLIDGIPDLYPAHLTIYVIETENDYSRPRGCFLISLKISVEVLHKHLCERLGLTYYKYSLRIDERETLASIAVLEDFGVGRDSKVYIVMKSTAPPEIRLFPCVPESLPRKSPSSHGDTHDESEDDFDLTEKEEWRQDRATVQLRVCSVLAGRKVKLEVRDLAESEKAISALCEEFQRKDVI